MQDYFQWATDSAFHIIQPGCMQKLKLQTTSPPSLSPVFFFQVFQFFAFNCKVGKRWKLNAINNSLNKYKSKWTPAQKEEEKA